MPICSRLSSSFLACISRPSSLEHLSGLKKLDLRLSRTPITGAGLVHLRSLRRLEELDLSATAVCGDGLRELQFLTPLKDLRLEQMKIADDALVHLLPLTSLRRLNLCRTSVSDKGQEHLGKVQHLRVLVLQGTAVTPSVVEQLRRALPTTDIVYPDRPARRQAPPLASSATQPDRLSGFPPAVPGPSGPLQAAPKPSHRPPPTGEKVVRPDGPRNLAAAPVRRAASRWDPAAQFAA